MTTAPYGTLFPPDGPAREDWAEVIDTTFYAPPSACNLINTRRGESMWLGLEITGEPEQFSIAFTDRDGRLVDAMHVARNTEVGEQWQTIIAAFAQNRWYRLTADHVVPALAATLTASRTQTPEKSA